MSADQPSALLSKTHRRLLDGETEYAPSDSQGRTTRTRLRERVATGIQDFAYLADPDRLADRDLELLLEDDAERERLLEGFREMIAFIYRASPDDIEYIVEDGVGRGVQRFSQEYEVDEVSVKIQKRGRILRQAHQQMDEDEPLSDRQIRVLLQHGDIDPSDLQEYVQSHPEPTDRSYRRRFR